MQDKYTKTAAHISRVAIAKRNIKNFLFSSSDICAICGEQMKYTEANIDHKIPRSKGGADNLSNMQLTHIKCNQEKAGVMPNAEIRG